MIKLKKMILPILGLGITTTAVSLSLTSCQPVYLILRDIDFSNGTMSDNAVAPQNSRIIDATNTMLYQDNYVFTWSSLPEGIPTPERFKEENSNYYAHLVLLACDKQYTITVTAELNYEGHIYKSNSHTVTVKKAG